MPQLDFSYYGVTICWSILKLLLFVCFLELSVIVFLGRSFHHVSFVLFKSNLLNLSNYFEKQFYVYFVFFNYISNLKYYQNYFSKYIVNNFIFLFFNNLFKTFFFKIYFNVFLFLNIERKKILKNKLIHNASLFFLLDLPYNGQMSFQDPATPIMEGIILFHHELLIIQIFIGIFVFWMLLRTVMLFRLKIFKLNKVMGNFFSPEYFFVKKDNMWDEKAKFIPAVCDLLRFISIIYGSSLVWKMNKNDLNYYKKLGFDLIFQALHYLKLNFVYGFFLYILKYRIVTFFEFFNNESEKENSLKLLQNYWLFTYLLFDLRHKSAYRQSLYYVNYINNFNEAFKIDIERESLFSEGMLGYENRVPSKVRHNTLLESVWTIIPSVVLIIIAIPSFALLYAMDELVAPAMTVHVMGNQWYWRYTYTLFRANNFSYYFNTINNSGINQPVLYEGISKNFNSNLNKFDLFSINSDKDFVSETILQDNTLSLKYWPVIKRDDTFIFLDYKSAIFDALEEMELSREWYFSDSYSQLSYVTLLAYLDDFNYCERLSIFSYLHCLCSYFSNNFSYYSTKALVYVFGEFMSFVLLETYKVVLLHDMYLKTYFPTKSTELTKYLEFFYISDVTELSCLRYVYIMLGHDVLNFYSLVYPEKDIEKAVHNTLSATIFNLFYLRVTNGFTLDEFALMCKAGSNTLDFKGDKSELLLNDFYSNEVAILTNHLGDFSNKTLNDLLHYIILKANYFYIYYPNMLNLTLKNIVIDLENTSKSSYSIGYLFNKFLVFESNAIVFEDISKFLLLNRNIESGKTLENVFFNSNTSFFSCINNFLVKGNYFNFSSKSYDLSLKGFFDLLKPANFLSLCSFEHDLKMNFKHFVKSSFEFFVQGNSSLIDGYYNFILGYQVWELQSYFYAYSLSNLDELSHMEKFKDNNLGNYHYGKGFETTDTFLFNFYIKINYPFESKTFSKGFKFQGWVFDGCPDIFALRKALFFVDEYVEHINNVMDSFYKNKDLSYISDSLLKFYTYSYILGLCQVYYHSIQVLHSLFFENYTGYYWHYYKIPFGNLMEFDGERMNYTTMCLQWYFLCWPFEEDSFFNFFNKLFIEQIGVGSNFSKTPYTWGGYDLLFSKLFGGNNNLFLWLFSFDYSKDVEKKRYLYNWNFLSCLVQRPLDFEDYISRKGRITFESRLKGNQDQNFFVLPNKLGMYRLLDVDNILILPERISIRLLITSSDVLHSWAVPSLGIKLDACPGRLNQTSVYLKRIGTFYGQCSEICGINHAFMPIVVKSIPLTSYTYMRLICFNKAFLSIFKKIDLPIFNINRFMLSK